MSNPCLDCEASLVCLGDTTHAEIFRCVKCRRYMLWVMGFFVTSDIAIPVLYIPDACPNYQDLYRGAAWCPECRDKGSNKHGHV